MKQIGIIRVNDLDCVDETSVAQFAITQMSIQNMLFELGSVKKLNAKDEREIENVWIEMCDKISYYYLGSRSKASHLIRPTLFQFLMSGVLNFSVNFTRYYMSRFQDYGRQDNIDTLMGTIFSEGKQTVREQLLLRRRIINSDLSHFWPLTLILIAKRFTAPRQIKTTIELILSAVWMTIYLFLIIVIGIDPLIFIRKPHRSTFQS